jgi:anti-sigma-K factor RskA
MSDRDRRTGWAGGSSAARRTRRSARVRLAVAGAVGVVGFAVFYFFDPQEGPRRRRQAIEALQDAALDALRVSQQLVNRLAEPVAEPRRADDADLAPIAADADLAAIAADADLAPAGEEDADLASTLHDEVAIFRFEPPPPEEAVPVGVGGPAEDPLEHEDHARGEPAPSERVSYVHSVTSPPTPRPTIISYDAVPADEKSREYRDVEASTTASSTRRALVGAAAAVVLLAAAGLGAWAIWGTGDESTATPPVIPSGASAAIQLISQPGARSVSVAGSKGAMVLVVAPDGRAALIISGLEAAPPGKEYQAWIVTGKTPKSAALFKGGSARLVIPLGRRVPKGAIFAVTLERAGGVPAPTQAPRFTAKLA